MPQSMTYLLLVVAALRLCQAGNEGCCAGRRQRICRDPAYTVVARYPFRQETSQHVDVLLANAVLHDQHDGSQGQTTAKQLVDAR